MHSNLDLTSECSFVILISMYLTGPIWYLFKIKLFSTWKLQMTMMLAGYCVSNLLFLWEIELRFSFSKNLEKSKILKQDLLTFWCELSAESTAEFFPGQPCWLLRAQPASVFLSCQQTETPLSSEQNNNNGYKKNKKTNEQFQNLTKTNRQITLNRFIIR